MTPLEKAIRAGCIADRDFPCHYPTCGERCNVAAIVRTGVAAALADDEATINVLDAELSGWVEDINSRGAAHDVLAALRRHILGEE